MEKKKKLKLAGWAIFATLSTVLMVREIKLAGASLRECEEETKRLKKARGEAWWAAENALQERNKQLRRFVVLSEA